MTFKPARTINPAPTTRLASAVKKFVAVLAAALASTVLVAVAPTSATANIRLTNAGDLIITGTSGSDHARIIALGDSIEVELRSGSQVVNRYLDRVELRRDVVVNLRGGGGSVAVVKLDVPRDLKINMGSGQNQVVYEHVEVGRNTNVIDGSGEAHVTAVGSTVFGLATFSTGAGISHFNLRDNDWGGNFNLRIAASGRFVAEIDNDVFLRPARLTGGNNSDSLRIRGTGTEFKSTTTMDLRGGDDLLDIDGIVRFARTTFRTGSGADQVNIYDAIMNGNYTIDMGSGDDIGTLQSLMSHGQGTVNGGAGTGDLLGAVNLHGKTLRVRGVEGGYGY